ncbi:hypothetical protein Tco_0663565 [Tanacetum coccineum]
MLANDEEMARKVQEEWEAEEEKKRLTEEEATKTALTNKYDFIQARLNADKILDEKREKIKRSDENFIAIGSVEDERLIKDLNKKATGIKKDDSNKGVKVMNRSKDDSEKENDELRLCLTIAPDEDKEVDYEILDKKYPIIEWKSEYLENKPQFDKTKDLEEINLNDDDLNAIYQLVMDRYQDEIPQGFDRVLWGDFMIMFNLSDKDEFWNSQHDWNVLESEEDSTMELELIRFVKKLITELELEDSEGNEEDL